MPIRRQGSILKGWDQMTERDVNQQVKAIQKVTKRISASPKAALAFLIKTGICTKNGKLTSAYR